MTVINKISKVMDFVIFVKHNEIHDVGRKNVCVKKYLWHNPPPPPKKKINIFFYVCVVYSTPRSC